MAAVTIQPPEPPSCEGGPREPGDAVAEALLIVPAPLRQLRRYAGLSQRALADRAGVHWETIQAIETGKRSRPHPATMAKIAAALGRRIEDISEFANGGEHVTA